MNDGTGKSDIRLTGPLIDWAKRWLAAVRYYRLLKMSAAVDHGWFQSTEYC